RSISYHFRKIRKPEDKYTRYFLDGVVRPGGPTETYYYEAKGDNTREAVNTKETLCGRILRTEYFEEGTQKAGKRWVKVSRDDGIFRRVKCQKAPVSTDQTLIKIRSFCYNLEENYTDVYDACNCLTRYRYSDDSVLTS